MTTLEVRPSQNSMAESTKSDMSAHGRAQEQQVYEKRKSLFNDSRKRRQSVGAYTSLFMRKLLPPLGFYREVDKYVDMKTKFVDDPDKLDALNEMWHDYNKYQIRKRFRWPPNLILKKFFWTSGYYADYQKQSRATKLRKPGEDSSDDEFIDPAGQYLAVGGEDDINLEEFDRYRAAKKLNQATNPNRKTRFYVGPEGAGAGSGEDNENYLVDRRPTVQRLFDEDPSQDGGKGKRKSKKGKGKSGKEIDEVETIVEVEYTLVKDPNKKKRKKTGVPDPNADHPEAVIPGLNAEDTAALRKAYEQKLASGKEDTQKLITRRRSVAKTTVDESGQKIIDLEEHDHPISGDPKSVRRSIKVVDDEYIPVRHSLTTLSTIWDTGDVELKRQYSTHTLTVTNLPDKVGINAMTQLFPGAKVNLKTPKKAGEQPYATIRFKDSADCKKYFIESRNVTLEGKKLVVNPKVRTHNH